jgi:hypothetical protein
MLGCCQVLVICTYVIPIGLMAKIHTDTWSQNTQSKSYLSDHICGVDTDRRCP